MGYGGAVLVPGHHTGNNKLCSFIKSATVFTVRDVSRTPWAPGVLGKMALFLPNMKIQYQEQMLS
jgi:hypothetical protein